MIHNELLFIVGIFQIVFFIYISAAVFYLLVFSFASLFKYKPKVGTNNPYNKIAVLIPAYREDDVILEVTESALKHNYPKNKFDVIVIADSFKQTTLHKLNQLDIVVFAKDFEISTKSRALNHALRNLDRQYDIACILDADNLMEKDFLFKINDAFVRGFTAVQGHRAAKNLNTNFAVLDAISEEINNNIFRKGQRVLGLSSFLIGSAMAFDYRLFKTMMSEIEVVGGFDKELEMRLLSDRNRIEYLPDAYVYDEKVQNARVFSKQRRRWLSAQFYFFGKKFIPASKMMLKNGNFEYFFKSLLYLLPPRIMLLGILTIMPIVSYLFISDIWLILWLSALLALILVFLFSIPKKFYTFRTLKAVLVLPKGFFLMSLSLIRMKNANEKFIHTKHTYNAFQIKRKKKNTGKI
jgi:cellulose synthase/poly-beta-1,6-N-acetylglucosamine synthase-like glycosyltransferase